MLAFGLLVAGAVAWEWTAPRRTVESLREAAVQGDTAELRDLVDFEAVRENLRTDAADRLSSLADDDPGGLASLGLAMSDALVEQALDALVTPAGVAALARGRISEDAELEIERTGLTTFLVRFDQEEGVSTPLEFRRAGLGWRLVHIRVESLPSTF